MRLFTLSIITLLAVSFSTSAQAEIVAARAKFVGARKILKKYGLSKNKSAYLFAKKMVKGGVEQTLFSGYVSLDKTMSLQSFNYGFMGGLQRTAKQTFSNGNTLTTRFGNKSVWGRNLTVKVNANNIGTLQKLFARGSFTKGSTKVGANNANALKVLVGALETGRSVQFEYGKVDGRLRPIKASVMYTADNGVRHQAEVALPANKKK